VLAIPGSFLVDADFDNEVRIPLVGCRTLILYGESDNTAVPERNALVLLKKADPGTTEGYPIDGANHSDLPEVMGYGEYERVVKAFVAGDSL
jgi:pimeloyl-ACP methyl ester carboxylesterase